MSRWTGLLIAWLAAMTLCAEVPLDTRIDRYAGDNAAGLKSLLATLPADTLGYVSFILTNASDPDLAVLTPGFLMENVRLALMTRSLTYTNPVPDDEFRHFVLPPRVAQEPFEPWRRTFWNELSPMVRDCTDIEQAITRINLWCAGQMTFLPTNGRDQGPLTTIRRMHGRCEEMMILFISAARAMGIPARSAYTPYWNFTDNNHAWTEVWTPSGWKFLGSGEPSNRLSDTWFTQTSTRATLVLAEAFGDYSSERTIRSRDGVSLLNTTSIYAATKQAEIRVRNVAGQPLAEAAVTLYGASYGGEMAMLELTSDENGLCRIELGSGAVWVTASRDSLFAQGMLDTMTDHPALDLVCTSDLSIDTSFALRFPLPVPLPDTLRQQHVLDDFDTQKELWDLRFTKRHAEHAKPVDFLPWFDLRPADGESDRDYTDRRKRFLDQAGELGMATGDYLAALNALSRRGEDSLALTTLKIMLSDWDIKDLCELPDTSAILGVARCYASTRGNLPDSLWREHVLDDTFGRRPAPETGWEPVLLERVRDLRRDSTKATLIAVLEWLETNTVRDDSLRYTYFSGAMTPIDALNLHRIPGGSRNVLTASALKVLGVPVRWRGFLEYWDGEGFMPVFETTSESGKRDERTFTVTVRVDGKPMKAEPFGNFMVTSLEGGSINETYFDSQPDSLDQKVTLSLEEGRTYYLEGMIRNGNGDAAVRILTLGDADHYTLDLATPRESVDQSALWSEATRKSLQKTARKWGRPGRSKLVLVLHNQPTEPQNRILTDLTTRIPGWKDTDVLVWCDGGMSPLLSREQVQQLGVRSGASWIDRRDLPGDPGSTGFVQQNYPMVFLLDAEGTLVFSSRGYQMGLGDLLTRKIANGTK